MNIFPLSQLFQVYKTTDETHSIDLDWVSGSGYTQFRRLPRLFFWFGWLWLGIHKSQGFQKLGQLTQKMLKQGSFVETLRSLDLFFWETLKCKELHNYSNWHVIVIPIHLTGSQESYNIYRYCVKIFTYIYLCLLRHIYIYFVYIYIYIHYASCRIHFYSFFTSFQHGWDPLLLLLPSLNEFSMVRTERLLTVRQ